ATLDASVRVILAEPHRPGYGEEVPMALEAVSPSGGPALLVGHPRAPMEPNAEHVVIVTGDLRAADGSNFEPDRITKVQLGLSAPSSQAEADLHGYHAPLRALLEERGVDPSRVLRAWDFTTRSEADARKRLIQ